MHMPNRTAGNTCVRRFDDDVGLQRVKKRFTAQNNLLQEALTPFGSCLGRKIEKQVPLLPGRTLLRIWIEPPNRLMIPLATHSPSPVPYSPLVVKDGSKTCAVLLG
jgi:hypothetical protein